MQGLGKTPRGFFPSILNKGSIRFMTLESFSLLFGCHLLIGKHNFTARMKDPLSVVAGGGMIDMHQFLVTIELEGK